MSTLTSKIQALLTYANGKTGNNDTTLGDAVRSLCDSVDSSPDYIYNYFAKTQQVEKFRYHIAYSAKNKITIDEFNSLVLGSSNFENIVIYYLGQIPTNSSIVVFNILLIKRISAVIDHPVVETLEDLIIDNEFVAKGTIILNEHKNFSCKIKLIR